VEKQLHSGNEGTVIREVQQRRLFISIKTDGEFVLLSLVTAASRLKEGGF
jgi:hypothetical protein